jgi:hypothetical protein
MKRTLTIAAGLIVGLLLSGAVAPALIVVLPARMRGGPTILGAAAIVVALTTLVSWWATAPRR